MSVDEFLAQVAWLGVQPSPFGRGEASTAQEPVPVEEPVPDVEDEPIPPEPFIFETDSVAQEEAAAQEPTSPVPVSPAPVIDDSQPSAPASKPEQPIVQDPPTAPELDLNEHAKDHPQED